MVARRSRARCHGTDDDTATMTSRDGHSFLPQLQGEEGSPRDWLFFHFEPMSGRQVRPPARFLRDHRWKLYEDGRMFDLAADPDEDEAIFDEQDTGASREARRRLEPIFGQMVR